MSGEDESQSPEQSTDNLAVANQELTKEQKSARNGQILSMAGMMGMFIITILLGLMIRPFYDSNNLQAFGESGTTQARYVILQLSMIFIFTAIILALAKWKKDWIIKYGIMGIMAIALLYSTVPLAHVILVEDMTEDFNIDSTDTYDTNYATATWSQNGFLTTIESDGQNNTTDTYHYWEGGDSIAGEPSWSASVPHTPADIGSEIRAIQGQMNGDSPGYFTVTNGAWVHTIDNQGNVVEEFKCFTETEEGAVPLARLGTGCQAAITVSDSLYVFDINNFLHRYVKFDNTGEWRYQASWVLPSNLEIADGLVRGELLDSEKLWITTPSMSIVIELEEFSDGLTPVGDSSDAATLLFELHMNSSMITSAQIGISPWAPVDYANYNSPERLMLIGNQDGEVLGYNWNSSESPAFWEEDRLSLSGFDKIESIRFTDIDENGFSELIITTNTTMHFLRGTSLVENFYTDVEPGTITNAFTDENLTMLSFVTSSDGNMTINSGDFNGYMFMISGLYFDNTATLIGLFAAALMMVLLFVHSEWYIVNTSAVLVGAGVIAMLGITFVPSLIIIFLILAAIYDAWAVYKSKHMLDLADTMLKQRLPILLVAPQEKGYSFIEETASMKDGDTIAGEPKAVPAGQRKPKKKPKDAMFMGLGDIIFPGMLVVSAMQNIDGTDGVIVATGTLIGGLVGYVALMGFVASGRPQAGLPLLNGGAILGYIISALITIGGALFSFGITL